MKIKQLTTVILVISTLNIIGQRDIMMLNLGGVMQSRYVNPAMGSLDGIHVGLPFMSSVSAQHQNNFLHPQGLFEQVEERVEFRTDLYLESVDEDNRASFDLATDVFSIGFPFRNNYFSFAIREKASLAIELPRDLLRFPVTGNAQFDTNGGLIDLSDLDLALNHYVEYGLGWQRNFGERLELGLTGKLLFGKENVRTSNNDFSWQTDPEDYTWTFNGGFDLETAGIESQFDSLDGNTLLENGKVAKYIFGSKNLGLGIDLGALYKVNEKWTVGLSMVDLGFIRYSQDLRNYSGIGSDIAFVGVEITEAFISSEGSFSDSLDAAISELGLALEESLSLERNESDYTIGLRTKAYFSVAYEILSKENSIGRLGLNVFGDMDRGVVSSPLASFAYTHSWADRISISAAYSFLEEDRKNLGLAMSIKGGPAIFYLSFDNVMWTNMTKIVLPGTDGEVTYPSFSQNAAIHFGMNLLLNKKSGISPAPRS